MSVARGGGVALVPGRFGPIMRGGTSRPRWGRRLAYALVGTTVVVLAAAGAVVGAWWHAVGQVEATVVPGLTDRAEGPTGGGAPSATVLVAGITRTEEGGRRADPVTLVRHEPDGGTTLLSLPPDLVVTRCDGERGWLAEAVTASGGLGCLVETVGELTGLPLDHLVAVELAGLAEAVPLLGGVRVHLDAPVEVGGVELPAGCVDVDGGLEVLAVVRAGIHDVGRGARQAALARAVAAELTAWRTLVDVPRVLALGDTTGQRVTTDADLSVGDLRALLTALRDLDPAAVAVRILPTAERTVDGVRGTVVLDEEAAPLLAALAAGAPPPEGVGLRSPTPLQPADVPPVRVLNGTETEGLAADTAERLAATGFTVDQVDDADRDDFERTLVVFPEHLREEAGMLADALADPALVPGDPDEPLTVVLGGDHDPGTVGRGFAPPPEPEPYGPPTAPARC